MEEKKYIDLQKWSRSLIYILLIIDILLTLIVFSITVNDISKIYLFMLIYSISSAIIFMIIIEIFKVKLLTVLKLLTFEKKPRIFEFGFFFFSFLATFFTIFASGLYSNPENFLSYIEETWYFMTFYGIAFASGWYHYILRIDY